MVGRFVILLLWFAILRTVPASGHWWDKNGNKLKVAVVLSVVTLGYYFSRPFGLEHGGHTSATGWPTVLAAMHHAIIAEFIPFIVLLFSLYTISGGISVTGDIPAHPKTNTLVLAIGALIA